MVALLLFTGLAAFAVAYFTYGKFLSRLFDVGSDRPTPAHTLNDGRDYHPARAPMLLGHHFSSIAGAGPIVGPIFATLVFGWLPAAIWVVVGSIFIGGVHDYGSLALSIKHGAASIAQVSREHMSLLANKLFLVFIWLTLVYVLVVFLDLTAATFAPRIPASMAPEQAAALAHRGGGVASSSMMFIMLALGLGLALHRFKVSLLRASLLLVPLLFLAIWAGQRVPVLPAWMPEVNGSATKTWSLILLGYCLLASVLPVWFLLQPRDYLSSYLLYAALGGGIVGVAVSAISPGGEALTLAYPAFLGFQSQKLGYLYPALFITIACGACSGFHSVVASGTTAKQLNRERDARVVGYGGMLLEGVLALLAIATVAILSRGDALLELAPPALFATGLGRFLSHLGVPAELGKGFGLLALSTFLLTTLDTATRLGRYIFEELFELKGKGALWVSTLATLALPTLFSLMTFRDAAGKAIPIWRIIWPVFGSTNQLLGGLALLVITVWLKRTGRPIWPTLFPMLFMVSATLLSLGQLIWFHGLTIIGTIAAALFVLAVLLLWEAMRALMSSHAPPVGPSSTGS